MKKIDMILNKLLNLSLSKKLTIIYFVVLIVLAMIFLLYIKNCLIFYENNQTDTYVNNFIDDLASASKKGNLKKYIDLSDIEISSLEKKKTTVDKAYYYLLKNSKITYNIKSVNDKNQSIIYIIYSDLRPILEITITKGKKINKLGLLNFNLLEKSNIKSVLEKGLYYYDMNIPSNYTVQINGYTLSDKYLSSTENNSEFNSEGYGVIPANNVYKINNLLYEPEIIIYDENKKEVTYKKENNIISIASSSVFITEEQAMKKLIKSFDVLTFAKKWSLFLTDDLTGNINGFKTLEEYLIKGSTMWNNAYAWATGIDITFVSNHTFKNPAFTNEKISNFVIYNNKAFSCAVYLEKNMIVNGNTKVDVMSDRLYFIYYDNSKDNIDNPTWKLVNMKAITKE